MRVLFTTWAWPTHFQPMVTLAWAFRAAGHEVRVASQPSLMPVVRQAGLPGVPLGEDAPVDAAVSRLLAADPSVPGSGSSSRTIDCYAEIAELMADPLAELIRGWRPDLVVFEESTYAAPLVAAQLDVPAVRHLWGVDILSFIRSFEPAALAPLAGRLGVDAGAAAGLATVDHCPPSIQVPGDFTRLPMRYVPFNGSGVLPAWLAERTARPRICVTYGTTSSRLTHYEFVLGRIVRAVAELPVEVVVAASAADADRLGRVPENVRVARHLPLHTVLPGCDLLISQAGPSTALTAASCGVPQLMIPQLPDQKLISTLVAGVGAGERLAPEEAGEQALRDAVQSILDSPRYAAAATRLRGDSASQPRPDQVVADLQVRAERLRVAV